MTGGSSSESLGTVISARDLTRRFGRKVALDDVRFEVQRESFTRCSGRTARARRR